MLWMDLWLQQDKPPLETPASYIGVPGIKAHLYFSFFKVYANFIERQTNREGNRFYKAGSDTLTCMILSGNFMSPPCGVSCDCGFSPSWS